MLYEIANIWLFSTKNGNFSWFDLVQTFEGRRNRRSARCYKIITSSTTCKNVIPYLYFISPPQVLVPLYFVQDDDIDYFQFRQIKGRCRKVERMYIICLSKKKEFLLRYDIYEIAMKHSGRNYSLHNWECRSRAKERYLWIISM